MGSAVDKFARSERLTDLLGRLKALGYARLFLSLDDSELNKLWQEPRAAEALAALISDSSADKGARFLAAEILFRRQPGFPTPSGTAMLAPIYAAALRHAELGNPWGMPGELDGPAGQHLVAIGRAVAVALVPLLDDARAVFYGGSEEATIGNSYRYRVKDFAAFFIHCISGVPYVVRRKPAERDGEIEQLRALL
jgi:hypothetical protein